MACLDSTFLVDLQRGRDAARSIAEEFDEGDELTSVPGVVAAELWTGAFLAPESERKATRELLESLVYRDLTPQIARRAGRLRAELVGRDPGTVDCIIAATAIEHGEALVTRDDGFREIRDASDLRLRFYESNGE